MERRSFQFDAGGRQEESISAMGSEQGQIAELEAEIERLRDAAERGRKIDLATRVAIGLGIACLASSFLWFRPVALVIGLGLLLGGVALHGSNRTTLDEIVVRIRATEAHRAALIDSLELEPVRAVADGRLGA